MNSCMAKKVNCTNFQGHVNYQLSLISNRYCALEYPLQCNHALNLKKKKKKKKKKECSYFKIKFLHNIKVHILVMGRSKGTI